MATNEHSRLVAEIGGDWRVLIDSVGSLESGWCARCGGVLWGCLKGCLIV